MRSTREHRAGHPQPLAQAPRPGSGDPRIFVVDYDPTQVVELNATMGYQTFIEFSPDEHIENVAVGDATGWQITPNRAANRETGGLGHLTVACGGTGVPVEMVVTAA